jgi:hypothetical protein
MNPWLSLITHALVVVAGVVVAVLPGSAVVRWVFHRVDAANRAEQLDAPDQPALPGLEPAGDDSPTDPGEEPPSLVGAGRILRGGLWIGRLERLATYVALLTGYPSGLAVALAVKSLARYPELKSTTSAAAERFIIGTFVSVLWAAGIAGLTQWVLGLW